VLLPARGPLVGLFSGRFCNPRILFIVFLLTVYQFDDIGRFDNTSTLKLAYSIDRYNTKT
jgi:hypothetical protein